MRKSLKALPFALLLLSVLFVSCQQEVPFQPEEPTLPSSESPITPDNPSNPATPQTPAIQTFTVTYATDYGVLPDSLKNGITVTENTVLTAEQLPELTDNIRTFAGWYDGNTKAVAGTYKVTRDVTLSSSWASEIQANKTAELIQSMEGSGTITVVGEISAEIIRDINAA